MSIQLRVYFSFRSPYSRLGLHKIGKIPRINQVNLMLIPFIRPAGGAPFLNPTDSPPKMAYYAEDAPRETHRMGLSMKMPDPFEVDFFPANLALAAAQDQGHGLAFALAVSDCRWGDGDNISKPIVLEKCAKQAGLALDFISAAQKRENTENLIESYKDLCDQDGAFGVPFAALEIDHITHKFWGQDRFYQIAPLINDAINGSL